MEEENYRVIYNDEIHGDIGGHVVSRPVTRATAEGCLALNGAIEIVRIIKRKPKES